MARAAWTGLGATLVLVAAAMLLPAVTGWNVEVKSFPPLHAEWDPRVGAGTVPAIMIALLAFWQATALAATLSWGRLLILTWLGGVLWMLALAFVDGRDGVGVILETPYEYLRTAHRTTDLPRTLETYVSRISYDAAPRNWPVHIAGHPAGALTFFVALVRLGLGGGFAAGLVVTLIAASTAAAVLITVRILGSETLARRAAPFLVLGPAAIWQSVSADAMFAAVAAWGIAALALAATRSSTRAMLGWSIVSGLLLGYLVMLSYGLPLFGILAVAVLYLTRSWRPLVPTALAALAVVLTYAAFGFYWWEAIGELRERYWDGVASDRPPEYWMWGNLAALACSAGPMLGVAVAAVWVRRREARTDSEVRVVVVLVAAALAMVVAADVSQMSRAEVERIWLPFVPWLLLGCALLPERWRRGGLAAQLVAALVLQHLLFTGW